LRVTHNEYLPVVYNGTFGAHHFCDEYLCALVFVNIGYVFAKFRGVTRICILYLAVILRGCDCRLRETEIYALRRRNARTVFSRLTAAIHTAGCMNSHFAGKFNGCRRTA